MSGFTILLLAAVSSAFSHLGRSFEGSGSYQGQFRVIPGDELANAFKTAARHREVEIGRSISGACQGHLGSRQGHFKFIQVRFKLQI